MLGVNFMDGSYSLTGDGSGKRGTVFDRDTQTVVVHNGRRGKAGPAGPKGDKGDQGDSIHIHESWQIGETFCPRDAVTDRSRLMVGVTSLYIQKETYPCAPLTVAPYSEPSRWIEVSAHQWGNTFGGIWEVYQIDHGFTKVGQPVGYSYQANAYVLANAGAEDELGLAVVREVIDSDRVILQSSGEVPDIDPTVIYPDGSSWDPGRIYYVSSLRGRLELTAPLDASSFVCPILMATDDDPQSGGQNGVALPWTPVSGREKEYIPVGMQKFFFLGTAGQTEISGPDLDNNLLTYITGNNTDVFVNGTNLWRGDYTATDGFRIFLTDALADGDEVEVWTPDRPLDILVRSTTLKLDNIEGQFDGVTTMFDLYYNGQPVVFQDASSISIFLDVNPQEPLVDYQLVDNGGLFAVDFKIAPELGTRFWGVALSPSGQAGVPSGGAAGAVLSKASSADGDMYWADVIEGGTW